KKFTFELTPRRAFNDVSERRIRESVTGYVDDLIGDARLLKHDFRSEPSDILWCGDRDFGIPSAQAMHCTGVEIDHTERRIKKKAGKHSCRNNHPLRPILRTK